MSKPKETLLNGDYAFLPNFDDSNPTRTHRRKILNFVISITLLLCFATFALGLTLGFHLHPHNIKVYVAQAKIEQFQLINNDTIHCKVELVMVFRNPDKRASVHYKRIYANGYYEGNRFGSVMLPKFHQGHDSIKTFYSAFEGKARMLMNWTSEEFYRGKEDGFVDVEIRGHTWIKYKLGFLKSRKRMVEFVCGMNRVALANKKSYGNVGFRGTNCDVEMSDLCL